MFEGRGIMAEGQSFMPFEHKTLPFEHLGWRFYLETDHHKG